MTIVRLQHPWHPMLMLAAMTAVRGVCGGIASNVPAQRCPMARRMFSITSVSRLSVPLSSTTAIPTETWNSDNRTSRLSGSSRLPTSANGRKRGPRLTQACMAFWL